MNGGVERIVLRPTGRFLLAQRVNHSCSIAVLDGPSIVYVLRVPVRYYRRPPPYFGGWRADVFHNRLVARDNNDFAPRVGLGDALGDVPGDVAQPRPGHGHARRRHGGTRQRTGSARAV